MANIVRVEWFRFAVRSENEGIWVAYFDERVGLPYGDKQDFTYCPRATDELSAYKEAMEYLDEAEKFK